MDPAQSSIIWGLVLFMVGILVPIIPAVLIYKLFPDDKIKAEGVIGQLKINATGAFAGYIIVLVIGRFMIPQIYSLIENSSVEENSPWIVKSKVVFLRQDNGTLVQDYKITNDSIFNRLATNTNPNYSQKDINQVVFTTVYKSGISTVTFAYPGFDNSIIDLTRDTTVKFDKQNHIINLGAIRLVRNGQEYNPKGFPVVNSKRPDYIPFDGPAINN
jgi:hypothetical protein